MKEAILSGNQCFSLRTSDLRVRRNPLIKVSHVGVCGTDFSTWLDGAHYPGLVIGHEYSGIIEDPGTTGLFSKGDRVAGYTQNVHNEACGHCTQCLRNAFDQCTNRQVGTWKGGELNHPGAYSEYTTWFAKSIYTLPDSVDLDEAALIEPFAVGLHAVELAQVQAKDKVLIAGGGIIGLTIAEWLKNMGVSTITITEMNRQKIALIKACAVADHVLPADDPDLAPQLQELSKGGYDVAFECAGFAPAINVCIGALRREFYKKLIALGLPHDYQTINYRDLVLFQTIFRGSKGHVYPEFEAVARAMAEKRINAKRYISKRIAFAELQKGFEEIKAGCGLEMKSLIHMS